MSAADFALGLLPLGVAVGVAVPLGAYLGRVLAGEPVALRAIFGPLERALLRWAGLHPEAEESWRRYAMSLLTVNGVALLGLFALILLQGTLPGNPSGLEPPSWHLALNTAISFTTNTNWQAYAGESTMSHLTQMVGLTTSNFLSAASGIAVMAAVARGFSRRERETVGSFGVDLVRVLLYVLLPASLLFAVFLLSQGVVMSLEGPAVVTTVEGVTQSIARGPVASQVAIKMLGTNGGGFFNANAAHPFENPTALSNLVQMVAILLLPAACCEAFGRLVGDVRQGRALLATMVLLLVPMLALGIELEAGNWEGKELRVGTAMSAAFGVFTTAASNGAVNAMHDSFTALGGLVPLWLILMGEVVFGGVGSGLYGMVAFALIAVFVAGLMVGRTPEYLGKKVLAPEIARAAVAVLAPSFLVLGGTAVAVAVPEGRAGVLNSGPHGFTEILYALASAANNNGSAFAGLSANSTFYNLLLGLAMLVGRYPVALALLSIAGGMAAKKSVPPGPGTLPTHQPLFVCLLAGVVVLVGALSFLPALALGPLAEATATR